MDHFEAENKRPRKFFAQQAEMKTKKKFQNNWELEKPGVMFIDKCLSEFRVQGIKHDPDGHVIDS
ncbi:MAG: hypothetical protein RLZZ262_1404 [Bacteroidota bacterium]